MTENPDTAGKDRLQGLIGEDYQLQWIIGHGGMSTVWLADDVRHDREVAIKVLRPEFSDNNEFLNRFRNEARAAQSIHHPHIISTYDYREIPDPAGHTFCFIAMEYVRGESLADLLTREKTLPEDMVLTALDQAAHGLAAIHSMGLVHRDIKPGNLLITQSGSVKITDFGIAKAAAAVPLTRTGMVVGTAQYVSPEQAQGHHVTAASDVYSLGVVGYEMLSGKRPFSGDSQVSVVLAHINEAPPALSTNISAPMRELIGISLRKDPATRFADGQELATAIKAVMNGHRPPQPAAAAKAPTPAEPSPSAATSALGAVTRNRTGQPLSSQQPAIPPARPGYRNSAASVNPKNNPVHKKKDGAGRGFLIGLLITAALALLIGGGVFLGSQLSSRNVKTEVPTTTPTEVVTEIVTPTLTETVEPEPDRTTSQHSGSAETSSNNRRPSSSAQATRPQNSAPFIPPLPSIPNSGNNSGEGSVVATNSAPLPGTISSGAHVPENTDNGGTQ